MKTEAAVSPPFDLPLTVMLNRDEITPPFVDDFSEKRVQPLLRYRSLGDDERVVHLGIYTDSRAVIV